NGNPIQSDQEDAVGEMRKVWVFPLVLVENKNPYTFVPESLLDNVYESQIKSAESIDIDELKKLARRAGSPASSRKTFSHTYTRNPFSAAYTKKRAKGKCELCKQSAPFKDKDDKPYLESHHIRWLSEGGYDSVENTAALCPNC